MSRAPNHHPPSASPDPGDPQVLRLGGRWTLRFATEIGEVLGIPVATVKTRMFYARKKLGEALKAAGYDRGWP